MGGATIADMPLEMTVPFAVTASGAIAVTSDPDEQITQHVLALINTEPDTRVMRPSYGVRTLSLLFEPDDFATSESLRTDVERAFRDNEPGIQVRAVNTNVVSDGRLDLHVDYARTGDAESSYNSAKHNLALIAVGGRVVEVVNG